MTRNDRTGKFEFGAREWIAFAALMLTLMTQLLGGATAWSDMKEKHAAAMEKLNATIEKLTAHEDRTGDTLLDHERRLRRLEGNGVAANKEH